MSEVNKLVDAIKETLLIYHRGIIKSYPNDVSRECTTLMNDTLVNALKSFEQNERAGSFDAILRWAHENNK